MPHEESVHQNIRLEQQLRLGYADEIIETKANIFMEIIDVEKVVLH